jgi:hypothetical protein
LKFKTIFVFFNILIIVSFISILCMPYFMLGWDYVKIFWGTHWYLAAVFFVVMAAMNAYFLRNWKLFSLLEIENWKGVREYLEELVYKKKKESRQAVRLLINTYIVLADTKALGELSRYLEQKPSRYFGFFALELGIPYLVENDPAAMRDYFERALRNPASRKKDWLRWGAAFAGLGSSGRETREAAAGELADLASGSREAVLRLLAVYLLDNRAEKNDESGPFTAGVRAALRSSYTRSSWEKSAGRFKVSLGGLILKQLLRDAENWLFEEGENNARV